MAYYKLANPTVSPSNDQAKKIEKWEMGVLKKVKRTQTILLSRWILDDVGLVVNWINEFEKFKESPVVSRFFFHEILYFTVSYNKNDANLMLILV